MNLSREVMIVNQLGLHARAAARFVSLANQFTCDIQVQHKGHQVNGKSIMGLMMLAASKGATITLTTDGDDAESAMDAITDLISNRFGESD